VNPIPGDVDGSAHDMTQGGWRDGKMVWAVGEEPYVWSPHWTWVTLAGQYIEEQADPGVAILRITEDTW